MAQYNTFHLTVPHFKEPTTVLSDDNHYPLNNFRYTTSTNNTFNVDVFYIDPTNILIYIELLTDAYLPIHHLNLKLYFISEHSFSTSKTLDLHIDLDTTIKSIPITLDSSYSKYIKPASLIYNQLIPKKIFQTYKTNSLTGPNAKSYQIIIAKNPEYEHHFYDDHMCQDFLYRHFGSITLQCFNSLKPGAFKADLWRYAVLYIHGGVYLDIDLLEHTPLRDIIPPDSHLVIVKDRHINGVNYAVYQAILACLPGDKTMKRMLEKCVYNVINKRYGLSPLDVTGPLMFGREFKLIIKPSEEMSIKHGHHNYDSYIVTVYDGNGNTVKDLTKIPIFNYKIVNDTSQYHYDWHNKSIYL